MQQVLITLPPEWVRWLRQHSIDNHSSISELIRKAVNHYFDLDYIILQETELKKRKRRR